MEPRYRYDAHQDRWNQVSREEERALEESGNAGELKGSIKPDVVIHQVDQSDVQAVYDFKFPCVNSDRPPDWTPYSASHPYFGTDQGALYEMAFGVTPFRVVPRMGIVDDE